MTAWKRTKHVALWLSTNAVGWGLLVAGTVLGMGWAFNIWAFLVWIFTLLYAFIAVMLVASHVLKIDTSSLNIEFGMPKIICFMSDLGMAILAAAFGHWFFGFLILFQQFSERFIREDIKPKIDSTAVSS